MLPQRLPASKNVASMRYALAKEDGRQ